MKSNLKFAVISVIGLLTLTVISAATINSLPLAKAAPYGKLISSEAKTDSSTDSNDVRKGYGDEVSPLAKNGGMGELRESGVPARNFDGDGPGQSDEDHGNDD
jgi:hypothetical protein